MPRSRPQKSMSSRLLTMKFMQRAAAASTSTPATPASEKSAAPAELTTPSPKRRKVSADTSSNSPLTPSSSDLKAISAAVKAEEEKRAAAIAKQAADAGETEWVLEFPAGTITNLPSAKTDSNPAIEEPVDGGRRSYGNYKKKAKPLNCGK
ncbi:hypothetical protein LOZ53_000146 [Ophidiomyces ophidiicola]|nr:hypothetical protein LOZ55_000216 [Ophidiomyces ophidiicola]KAI1987216.1 hypothetical protein LOZ54_003647 [Ophidiomyces ophidiicola]KAI1998360.1 hypothetical protein LOZ53_000146 [Ophidiomyces ophidiicola]KAI2000928.1 hypothetical protein LOZ51_001215 [Ophidiomyces ophidiicola]